MGGLKSSFGNCGYKFFLIHNVKIFNKEDFIFSRIPSFVLPKLENVSNWIFLARRGHKRHSLSSNDDVENLLTSSPPRCLSTKLNLCMSLCLIHITTN